MKGKFSKDQLVTRAYPATFRASDKEEERGVIYGTPIVFNQSTKISDWFGEYNEVIDRSALKNTDLKDVRLFVNHDFNNIALARSKNGNENSTMSFTMDDKGLNMRAVLDIDNNAEAKSLYSAIQRGDMDSMSFAFRVRGDEWRDIDSECPTRVVKDISIVHEVSVVNFPAYPQTSVSARGSEETDYSPLKEMREARAKEIADTVEIEKLKYKYLMEV